MRWKTDLFWVEFFSYFENLYVPVDGSMKLTRLNFQMLPIALNLKIQLLIIYLTRLGFYLSTKWSYFEYIR